MLEEEINFFRVAYKFSNSSWNIFCMHIIFLIKLSDFDDKYFTNSKWI